jgi:15-cis-phytoene synthase/lycopene beta-cyclase
VLGPTFFSIPIEELFFFFIQTYDVSLLYIIFTRPTFCPAYLPHKRSFNALAGLGPLGQIFFVASIWKGVNLIRERGVGTYMGLIVIWAFPFLLLLWSLSYKFILQIPRSNVLVPILLPTLYLWLVDTFALRRGTWVIEDGTKYGIHIWEGLDVEEAFFFLVTNMLVVFGQIAFDNAITVMEAFPAQFPNPSRYPSPIAAVKALLLSESAYDSDRIEGFQQAVARLKKKSRSFYLASSAFSGRLRGDLILLYSFCRVADDLVDNADSREDAKHWIGQLKEFLDISYGGIASPNLTQPRIAAFVQASFPEEARQALTQLPTQYLAKQPLYDLVRGFEMDLAFDAAASGEPIWPIKSEHDLEEYGRCVASTVADLCIELVFHHENVSTSMADQLRVREAGIQMGIALQIVNIARDIQVDAKMKRVYIPTTWLKDEGLTPADVLRSPSTPELARLRSRLLDKAFHMYNEARNAIEELPISARGPMRVAVDSYMEIGRVLREESYQVKAGRATVPKWRRIKVAWRALQAR